MSAISTAEQAKANVALGLQRAEGRGLARQPFEQAMVQVFGAAKGRAICEHFVTALLPELRMLIGDPAVMAFVRRVEAIGRVDDDEQAC